MPFLQNLYTVSFSKPGYVELSGLSLSVGTEISLSFSTLEDTGTILLAVGGASPIGMQVCLFFLIPHRLSKCVFIYKHIVFII